MGFLNVLQVINKIDGTDNTIRFRYFFIEQVFSSFPSKEIKI